SPSWRQIVARPVRRRTRSTTRCGRRACGFSPPSTSASSASTRRWVLGTDDYCGPWRHRQHDDRASLGDAVCRQCDWDPMSRPSLGSDARAAVHKLDWQSVGLDRSVWCGSFKDLTGKTSTGLYIVAGLEVAATVLILLFIPQGNIRTTAVTGG